MHSVKLLCQRLMARDFDRQVAELQVRVAALNGCTALGISVTKVASQVCPGKGSVRPSADLRKRADQSCQNFAFSSRNQVRSRGVCLSS
jgi:hypothetical protein